MRAYWRYCQDQVKILNINICNTIEWFHYHRPASELCKTRMANPPCSICERAFGQSSTFFSVSNDVLLAPINSIKRAASIGCPLCTVLTYSLKVEFLGHVVRERERAFLRRALLDPDRALAIYVGVDDVSHTSFSRVPGPWSTYTQDPLLA